MAKEHTYYMPGGAHEFLGWAKNFAEVAAEHAGEWGFGKADLDKLAASAAALEALITLTDGERATKDDIRRKNAALKDARELFRHFVNGKVNYNDAISDVGRANLRTHIRDTTRTRIERPAGHVRFWVRPLEDHNHRIDFVDEATGKKKMPYGMSGVVLTARVLAEGEAVPARGEDLSSGELMTSSPHVVEYGPERAGKRAAYAAAWQNETGQKGAFSDVQVYVIP